MQKLNQLLPFFLSLSVLKRPLLFKTGLNALLPLAGVLHFAMAKKLSRSTLFLIAITLVGIPATLINFKLGSFLKYGQLVAILLCFDFFLIRFDSRDYQKLASSILLLGIIIIPLEAFVLGPESWKEVFLGLKLPRFRGIIGETNFSAILYFGLGLILYNERKYLWTGISLILILCTGSHAALLFVAVFVALLFLSQWIKDLATYCGVLFSIGLGVFPFILPAFDHYLARPNQWVPILDKVTSFRYSINLAYLKIWKDHLYGVGYFQQIEVLKSDKYNHLVSYVNEEHNLFLQILVQLGSLAYGLVVIGIYLIFRKYCLDHNKKILLVCLLGYFLALNGTHELILYLMLAYCLRDFALKTSSKPLD